MTHVHLAAATPVVLAGAYWLCLLVTGQARRGVLRRYRYLRRNYGHTRRDALWLARRFSDPRRSLP